ncbi:lymphocyte antigen 75-like [Neocloeon triangulifer]|uniref:lymphocyte antigen 75-like n=1 Tax=Neocloeon triangulifer TaxID=2078957 RepID=UPI00286EF3C1|nr:lymphocyte antigen 75-like [Neocloeon triangulifer]
MATKMTGAAAVHFLWIFILLTIIQVQGQKSRYDNERNEKIADFRGFVHVNGTKYFIDTTPTHRDDAQAECISRDMNLISFQTEQKYDDAVQWLYDNGHEYDWMWSGALKNENSSTWIWEPIGEEISYFRWAPDEPTVNNDTIRTCISFSFWSLGWDDDNCLEYSLGYICE